MNQLNHVLKLIWKNLIFYNIYLFSKDQTNAKSEQEVDIILGNMNKKLAGIAVGATLVVVTGIVLWIIQNKERGWSNKMIILSILILNTDIKYI